MHENREGCRPTMSRLAFDVAVTPVIWLVWLTSRIWTWRRTITETELILANSPGPDTVAIGHGPQRTAFYTRALPKRTWLDRLLENRRVQLTCRLAVLPMFYYLCDFGYTVLSGQTAPETRLYLLDLYYQPLFTVTALLNVPSVLAIAAIICFTPWGSWLKMMELQKIENEKKRVGRKTVEMFTFIVTAGLFLSVLIVHTLIGAYTLERPYLAKLCTTTPYVFGLTGMFIGLAYWFANLSEIKKIYGRIISIATIPSLALTPLMWHIGPTKLLSIMLTCSLLFIASFTGSVLPIICLRQLTIGFNRWSKPMEQSPVVGQPNQP